MTSLSIIIPTHACEQIAKLATEDITLSISSALIAVTASCELSLMR